MSTAEKYREWERNPVINTARFIFSELQQQIPNSTLGEYLIDIKTGKTPSKQNDRFYEDYSIGWFKPDEVGSQKFLFKAKEGLSNYALVQKQVSIYEADTILINAIGDIGRVSILVNQASSNQQITGIRFNSALNVEYAYYYLVANRHHFYADFSKTTLPIVNQKKLLSIPIVVPEIGLQHIIINGLQIIEEIKSETDFHILDTIEWPEHYKAACKRVFQLQFASNKIAKEFTLQLSLVKKLRQSLLQDAVQGKLVPQDKEDEPATVLLQKIKAEKEALVAAKKLKKEKPLPPIKDEEIPFAIPKGWVWCRLGEIADSRLGKMLDQIKNKGEYYPYLRNLNVQWYRFELTSILKMKFEPKELEEFSLRNGDLLICEGGEPGRAAIWDQPNTIMKFQKALHRLRFFQQIPSRFILHYLKWLSLTKKIEDHFTGSGIQHLTGKSLKLVPIPLPPFSEMHRIIERLETLASYCHALEVNIKQSQKHAEQLLQVALKEALDTPVYQSIEV